MRLKTIKLSGFKSFVDPTSFHLPSNLLGVVGPNGCGKSNIIDAVRWVMGESSARLLRGEQMSDVIFNGSSARKPVSTATVELLFDNSDGSLGGEYAAYAEISIKRQVSREGQSLYFLNGQRCRRRDITDIFLGTGLGPRSYSIIEQGMISQIVDARPEDIRLHLEEAAGISKYKERRRETENRIRHTRENLERLDDLRSEVDKQLQHLKRQARQAERYKELKAQHRRMDAERLVLEWQHLSEDVDGREAGLAKHETRLEAKVAEQRETESSIEALREKQTAANEAVGSVQAELYEVGGDIARLEQAIAHRRELTERQRQEREEAEQNFQELQEHLALDRVQIEEHRTALGDLEPQLENARGEENEASDAVEAAEEAMRAWQDEWDRFSASSGSQNQQAEVERTRIDHLDRQLAELAERIDTLKREAEDADASGLRSELETLEAERKRLETQCTEREAVLETLREALAEQAQRNREVGDALNDQRQDQQREQGRLASLEALQQAALGEDRPDLASWLAEQGLENAGRLAQAIDVRDGWEQAAETVLGHRLEALLTQDSAGLARLAEAAADLDQGGLVFAARGGEVGASGPEHLLSKVTGPAVLGDWLRGVLVAEDLAAALALRDTLGEGESVIVRDGVWIGRDWVRVGRDEDEGAGVIAREAEIKALRAALEERAGAIEKAAETLSAGEERLAEIADERDAAQTELAMAQRRAAEVDGQAESKAARIEHLERRRAQLDEETESLRKRMGADEESVRDARGRLQESMDAMADLEGRRSTLEARRGELVAALARPREKASATRGKAEELAIAVESRRAGLRSTEQAVERMTRQMTHLEQRRSQLLTQIEDSDEPIRGEEKKLKSLLDARLKIDERLGAARRDLDQVNLELREAEHKRGQISDQVQELRSRLETARIDLQGRRVKTETVLEEIGRSGLALENLVEEMAEEATVEAWRESLERLDSRIRRLEPVNLAAIQEYEEQAERKTYLDAQNEDLLKALDTLEKAIHKIDRQTRTRFKETFDKVNTGVQELFPRLFGGGHGYLDLIGDDLLVAGVQIMARPPGKRVSNIHLLSGGEKALTAVAFVFAIFRLNPAPFCLLDEVDAPLDDANVGRFSELVKEMAEKVQFLFVTHNKITMEMAHQLSGVTMREPGVSRMVSVDIAEAERLAGQ